MTVNNGFVVPYENNNLTPCRISTMIRRMFIRTKYDPKLNRTRDQIVESKIRYQHTSAINKSAISSHCN